MWCETRDEGGKSIIEALFLLTAIRFSSLRSPTVFIAQRHEFMNETGLRDNVEQSAALDKDFFYIFLAAAKWLIKSIKRFA